MPRRRSTRVVAAGTAAFAALALTGCGSEDPDPDYQGVCVDPQTEQRVDDERCDDDDGRSGVGFVPFFLFFPLGARFPGIGQSYRGYPGSVRTVPAGHTGVRGGAATAGGTATRSTVRQAVSRGGFGTTGRGAGSVGG